MGEIKPFKNQDYALLKSEHNASNLFVDPEFPAIVKSLSHLEKSAKENSPWDAITWKRPKEAFENPQFVIGGFKRSDLNQGHVGNCWFIAACAAVTLHPDLLAKVIPQDQSFDDDKYTGMFHFRFWLYGNWYDVVVDDQLPFGPKDTLFYCHNANDPNELWAPLLEKAYAKVCGTYEAMRGGMTTDALIDMTAGVNEAFEIFRLDDETVKPPSFKEKMKGLLQQGYTRKSMLGCRITPHKAIKENKLPNGLVMGHAYTITRVKDVTTNNGETITLVRIRNPWGNAKEWNGDWSDKSDLWDTISDEEKERLKYRQTADGEFWMSFNDFYSNFHRIQLCHRGPSSLETTEAETDCIKWSDIFEEDQVSWKEEKFHGEWIPGKTAGGPANESNEKDYWTNPQYLFKLTSSDDVIFDFGDGPELCTVIVSLMQKETRERMVRGDKKKIRIAFHIYRVKDDISAMKNIEDEKLKFYSSQLESVENSVEYSPCRSVTKRCRLPPGTYVIIPSTYGKNDAAKFLLRIFTEKEIDQTVKTELDREKENLTEDDTTFINKDFMELLKGVDELLNEVGDEFSNDFDTVRDKEKGSKKEELCSLQ